VIAAPARPRLIDPHTHAIPGSPSRIVRWATSLQVLNRQPQGSAQIDSQAYPDQCDPTHPFHFDFYISSDVLKVNYARLSFFLRAFRRTLASVNTVTSAASSASSSGASSATSSAASNAASSSSSSSSVLNHWHSLVHDANAIVQPLGLDATGTTLRWGGAGNPGLNTNPTDLTAHDHPIPHTHDIPHSHNIPHTHDVTPTLVDGIWEGAVATGVTVKVNGVDRTSALGGGAGFTTNQTELALLVAWLNLGAWNTIDLTPTGLGRITGHLTVVSYIQSV
jgi:hypothetical protein